ncbi:hypothetical protein RJ641_005878 [Dillenia turbinata]|uniref:Uncharacterized protein n=1 Tax=Dillenia turbinata TaxID=194707 RepID=A0AAN8Z730_9MAGN
MERIKNGGQTNRGLVLYGDGLASFISSDHANLHSLASRGCSGFLSLPHFPPSAFCHVLIFRAHADDSNLLRMANSLPVDPGVSQYQAFQIGKLQVWRIYGNESCHNHKQHSCQIFWRKGGFSVLQFKELLADCEASLEVVTLKILELLGFQYGKAVKTGQFDIVVVHIRAGEKANILEHKITISDIELVDGLAGKIIDIAQPRSEIGSLLHLSVVMSYWCCVRGGGPRSSILRMQDPNRNDLSVLFPRQSYAMRGESPGKNIGYVFKLKSEQALLPNVSPAVAGGCDPKDMAETSSFKEFKEICSLKVAFFSSCSGGNLVIPADRFLHEIASKLWKAPKYGA